MTLVLESAFLLFFCGDRSYHIWMKGWRVKLSASAFEVIRQVALNKLYECVHTCTYLLFGAKGQKNKIVKFDS